MAVLRLFIDNIEDISTVTAQLEKLGQVSNVNFINFNNKVMNYEQDRLTFIVELRVSSSM